MRSGLAERAGASHLIFHVHWGLLRNAILSYSLIFDVEEIVRIVLQIKILVMQQRNIRSMLPFMCALQFNDTVEIIRSPTSRGPSGTNGHYRSAEANKVTLNEAGSEVCFDFTNSVSDAIGALY